MMKVEVLIGDELVEIQRIGEDTVDFIFQDVGGFSGDQKVLRIEAGIYGSYKHPDGIAELRMKMKGVVVDEEGP